MIPMVQEPSNNLIHPTTLNSVIEQLNICDRSVISYEEMCLTWDQAITPCFREVVCYNDTTLELFDRLLHDSNRNKGIWMLVYCLPFTVRDLYVIRDKRCNSDQTRPEVLSFSDRISPAYFLDDYCIDWETSRPQAGYTLINLRPLFYSGKTWTEQTEIMKQKRFPFVRANLSLFIQTLSAMYCIAHVSEDELTRKLYKIILATLKDVFLWSDLTYGHLDERILEHINGTDFKGSEMSPEWQRAYMRYATTFQFFGGITSFDHLSGTSVLNLYAEHIHHSAGPMLNSFESLIHDQ